MTVLDIGTWLYEQRTAAGLTQRQLAAQISVGRNTIACLENGRTVRPTLTLLTRLERWCLLEPGTLAAMGGIKRGKERRNERARAKYARAHDRQRRPRLSPAELAAVLPGGRLAHLSGRSAAKALNRCPQAVQKARRQHRDAARDASLAAVALALVS